MSPLTKVYKQDKFSFMKAKNSIYTCNEELFDSWTEKSSYLLGYLEADGYIKTDREVIRVYFQMSDKDLKYLEQLKQITNWTGTIGTSNNYANGKLYQKIRFTISSRAWKSAPLLGYLREGFIPPVPKSLMSHYVRGYFDGDGSIFLEKQSNRYKANFVFASMNLAEEFRYELITQGIQCSKVHKKTSSNRCWYFNISYGQIVKLGNYLYKNSTISLERKRLLFKKEEIEK